MIQDIVISVIKGAVTLFIIGLVCYGIYWILKSFGVLKIFKKKIKPSDEVYIDVAKRLVKGETFEQIAVSFSKFSKPTQDAYIQAYLEIKELKGGKQNG